MNRQPQQEWMDADDVDPAQLARSLRYIRAINRLLGYTQATISHLKRFSRLWKAGDKITIVDVATGSADIPRAIARWGRRRGFEMHIIGIDRHPQTVHFARAAVDGGKLSIVRADALALPLADQAVDYAITGMFLHHLTDEQAVCAMAEMARVARRGIIVADLIRSRRALFWIRLLTLLAGPMVRHDARASVKQAFSWDEIQSLSARAGLANAQYHRHFGHRFVITALFPGKKATPFFDIEVPVHSCR